MGTLLILADARPAYLHAPGAVSSLLLTPLGSCTLLRQLADELGGAEAVTIAVTPRFASDGPYEHAVRELLPEACVVPREGLLDLLDGHEPADQLLLVDAARFPASEHAALPLLQAARDGTGVRHLVHLCQNRGGTRERVVCDDRQRVRAIERLYDGVTQFESLGVSVSLIPVAAGRLLAADDLQSPLAARLKLVSLGVPTQDLTASRPALDLDHPDGLLALHERRVVAAVGGEPPPPYTRRAPDVWTAPGGRIHPTARISGPAILQGHVVVGERAVLIGPVVLGEGARGEAGAVVAQSSIGAHARVPRGTVQLSRVVPPGVVANGDGLTPEGPPRWSVCSIEVPGEAGGAVRTDPPGGHGCQRIKRLMDACGALVGLILLAPRLLGVAVLIKLTSRGPVLFAHEREGLGGRGFRCWKFRTMVDRAHAQQRALYRQNAVDGPQFKLVRDPRVTWLGHWLRTTNIDELPQLINVLCGQMSLIGPRPSPFRENQICVPWRQARLAVRPGITGLWQVCRHERNLGDFHQWIYFDMLYVRHVSLGLDLRILLATLVTFGGRWHVPLTWMIPARLLRGAAIPITWPVPGRRISGRDVPHKRGPLPATGRRPRSAGRTEPDPAGRAAHTPRVARDPGGSV